MELGKPGGPWRPRSLLSSHRRNRTRPVGVACGCGCVVVLVVFLLIAGLIGGGIYMVFKEAECREFGDGGNDRALHRQRRFLRERAEEDGGVQRRTVSASKTSTLTLSSDEINALLSHDGRPEEVTGAAADHPDRRQARVQVSVAVEPRAVRELGREGSLFQCGRDDGAFVQRGHARRSRWNCTSCRSAT